MHFCNYHLNYYLKAIEILQDAIGQEDNEQEKVDLLCRAVDILKTQVSK